MMNTKFALAILAVITLAAGIYLWSSDDGSSLSNSQALKAGNLLYQQNCASCHGIHLEGQPNWQVANPDGTYPAPPHDKTGHTWHHDDKLLFNYTKFGGEKALAQLEIKDFKSGMPGFGETLTDAQIKLILDYIKSTWPVEIKVQQKARS